MDNIEKPVGMKLHLGCYNIVHDGWINTDVTFQSFIARIPLLPELLFKIGLMSKENIERHRQSIFRRVQYLDVTKRFPYPDDTFDFVFSSHMLEHLCPDESQICIREIYRVMKPNGIMRLAVPDLDRMIAEYNPQDPDSFLNGIYQGRERRTHQMARHWWHYNQISLTRLLEGVGFREVMHCRYQYGQCADVEKIDNRPESLFVEAKK